MKLLMMIAEDDNTETIFHFWREKDAIEVLPGIVKDLDGSTLDDELDGLSFAKAVKYINKHTELSISYEEVEIEGAIDSRLLQQIEKEVEFDGPKLKIVKSAKTAKVLAKALKLPVKPCVTIIDGVRVS